MNMRDQARPVFSGKKVVVVGLGLSGLWTARWLIERGAIVTVSEIRPEPDVGSGLCKEVREMGAFLETGGHKLETLLGAELIVISPGVPYNLQILDSAREKGITVTGELELASQAIRTPIIAVTGTNGKSTVTTFLGEMLDNAGIKVFVGGNIGTPLMAYAAGEGDADYAVVEVSSFQLDTSETFCPFVSIILNISPDHLDRYADYDSYTRSKLRIFSNQGQGQYVILNDDDEILNSVKPGGGTAVLRYGQKQGKSLRAVIEDKNIKALTKEGRTLYFNLKSFRPPGEHNLENLLGCVLVGLILDIEASVIQKTIDEFKGLPDRLEHVGDLEGVSFYNDSKATNVDAAVRAVNSFDRPQILIAGGRHKGAEYNPLVKAARGRVKKAVFIGEAKELLAAAFKDVLPFFDVKDMKEAVSVAFSIADRGDVVLLAPACSSFDMFKDYTDRGKAFREAVESLSNG